MQVEQNDLTGHIFIATVNFINDPLKLGRIKVNIPGIFDSTDSNLLPWVGKKDGGPIANGSDGFGSLSLIPRIGSRVFVEFQNGDSQYPLYWLSPIQPDSVVTELVANYPNVYGFKDPANNLFSVDTTPGNNVVTFKHSSGTTFQINNDGSVTINAVAQVTSSAPKWVHTGDLEITGTVGITGDTSITGNTEHLGDVNVTGSVNATQQVVGLIGVVAGTLNLGTHVHPGVKLGYDNSAQPMNG